MNLKNAKILTVAVMIAGVIIVSAYDLFIYLRVGSEATISRILYHAASDQPIIGVAFGLAVGILLGHLFWAQEIESGKTGS